MKKSLIVVVIAAAIAVIYFTGCSQNELPVIDDFSVQTESDSLITAGDTVKIICEVSDPDGDSLEVSITADGGELAGTSDDLSWISPDLSGTYTLTCSVTDLVEDSTRKVSENLTIDVQNYFPMALGSWWEYEAPGMGGEIDLKIEVASRTELADNTVQWNLSRTFTFPDMSTIVDTFAYFKIKGDSIRFYDPSIDLEYLAFYLPLWQNKSWDVGDGQGGSGNVSDVKDRGTEAGNFNNCMEIGLNVQAEDRTLWLAPDVGIIVNKTEVLTFVLDFELVDYEL